MKTVYTRILIACLLVLGAGPAWAQWPVSPDSPMRVADSSRANYPYVLPDGQGGQYVFWADQRVSGSGTSRTALYGQRLSVTGRKLWGAAGRRIVLPRTRVWDYDFIRTSTGQLWAAYTQGQGSGDTAYVVRLDTAGAVVQRTLLAGRGLSQSSIYIGDMQLLEHNGLIHVAYYVTYTGGTGYIQANAVRPDGSLVVATGNGARNQTSSGGPFALLPALGNEVWLVWRNSNGAGTALSARRMNLPDSGRFRATTGLNLTAGYTGLGYEFVTVSDSAGGVVGVYRNSNPGKLMMFHIDAAGNHLLTPTHKVVRSAYQGTGNRPQMQRRKGRYYMVWADNRPPADNTDIYAHCMDAQGNAVWDTNGVRAIRMNSYIPHPKFTFTDSGAMVLIGAMSPGAHAQKVLPDGTLAWGEGIRLTAPYTANLPFYENYQIVRMADGGYLMVYITAGGGTLLATRVTQQGVYTGLEAPTLTTTLRLTPNPVHDRLQITGLPPNTPTLRIVDAQGRTILTTDASTGIAQTASLAPGLYTLQAGAQRVRFVKN